MDVTNQLYNKRSYILTPIKEILHLQSDTSDSWEGSLKCFLFIQILWFLAYVSLSRLFCFYFHVSGWLPSSGWCPTGKKSCILCFYKVFSHFIAININLMSYFFPIHLFKVKELLGVGYKFWGW